MKHQTKTAPLSRALTLAACWFLLPAILLAGCGAESAPPNPEDAVGESAQEIARPPRAECECLSPSGAQTTVTCYDSCFGSLECGPATAPCAEVCEYSDPLVELGERCETVGLAGGKEATGLCATDGVHGLPKRGGCCTDCIIESGRSITCGTGTGQCGDRLAACKPKALCTEKDSCLLPHCDSGDCTSLPVPIPVACEDTRGAEGACWGGKCCVGCMRPGEKAGQCIPLADQKPSNCGVAGQLCQNCDDGNVCNGREGCKEGQCVPGTPLKCEPRHGCETATCDPEEGCVFTPKNSGSCNDGNPCTENDTCSAGVCGGSALDCDDGNPCTTGSCDANSGACQYANVDDDTDCDDGTACTSSSRCQAGVCEGLGGCNDPNQPCMVSDCGPNGTDACTLVPKALGSACDDGDACTQGDACDAAGSCGAGATVDCDDDNACTTDACDTGNGCEYTPTTAECVDGNVCTTNDACVDGECVGEPLDCAPLDSCHEAGTCNPDSGVCDDPRKSDGEACGNGGECRGGSCEDEDVGVGGSGVGGSGPGDAGAAGDDGAAGEAGADGMGGTGGDGGTGGLYDGEPYVRHPKGCSCRTVGGSSPSSLFGLLAGLTVVGAAWRRRRWDIGA